MAFGFDPKYCDRFRVSDDLGDLIGACEYVRFRWHT